MLTPILSRQRQKRLLSQMEQLNLDAVVVGWAGHVYYFTAHLTHYLQQSAFVLFADGRSLLVTANAPNKHAAADDLFPYTATVQGTQRQEQPDEVAKILAVQLAARSLRRIGVDASPVTAQLLLRLAANSNIQSQSIEPALWQLRRPKDADELELMQKGIDCCTAMYARAREIITPGVTEIEVYNHLHAAALEVSQEPLNPPYLGNDYTCGDGGGGPREHRAAKSGELYILDLGPAYRGYFSDNARTFAVNRNPTDAQLKAWEHLTAALKIVETLARPGASCTEIFQAVDEHLKQAGTPGMTHHLGHGVGLQPHEYPHLNPDWNDTLIEGEIFTAEPGLYSDELKSGMRIENQYLVTAMGVKNLTSHIPLELA